ncbi:bile acid-CoA:amino acid N-acyltransferase-like isoform X2 [Colossoma macropomum]|nr:bile acid-CoA:amino acid N-acyltransferase-like isoform X2 [Colossoma macropomum]
MRWRVTDRMVRLLTATPSRALMDEQIVLKGHYLPCNSPVTFRARMRCENGNLWESMSHYHTDENGDVDLTRDSSMGGSYIGCEPMGLFWSLQPARGQEEGLRLRKKNVDTPYTVHVTMLEGHILLRDSSEDEEMIGKQELATVTVQRWYKAPGVQRIEICQNQVVGTLFLPPGPGPFPGVLDLWGIGGGLVEYRAALFASRGLASLALAYFNHKDIPGPRNHFTVGDSYFKAAWRVLQDHPQVCGNRMAIIGLSFGVFIALRMAMYPSVSPKCVVCINGPLGVYNSLANEDRLTCDTGKKLWGVNQQGYLSFWEASLPSNFPPANIVQIEKLECPLLYIVGEDDLSCASMVNADEIEKRLLAVGKSHLFTRVSYPGAGHLIEPPYTPCARTSLWAKRPTKLFTQWGGKLAEHAAAQEDSWQRILGFLECNLRGEQRTQSFSTKEPNQHIVPKHLDTLFN